MGSEFHSNLGQSGCSCMYDPRIRAVIIPINLGSLQIFAAALRRISSPIAATSLAIVLEAMSLGGAN